MKRMALKVLPLVLLTVLIGTSCKKYESGPDISIIPRKDRVANTWIIGMATSNGDDVTEKFERYELYLTADGDAELDAKYVIFGETFEEETKGTWSFKDNDQNIEFDFEDDRQDGTYQILKLTKTEFWLREIGKDLELQLEQK